MAGIRHWYAEQQAQLDDEQLDRSFAAIETKQEAAKREMGSKRQQLAEQFLQINGQREEVTVTDSGLQYEVLEAGSGASPGTTSTVRTHYHGTLVDGSVFDSSVERDEPAEFGVDQVISGWTEALQLMRVGDKWRITCPPHLAYGSRGAGDSIPPDTTLIFEIELLAILD